MAKSFPGIAIPTVPTAGHLKQLRWPTLTRERAVELWPRLALAAILALSASLHFLRLTSEGYGNSYYAATVKNMLTSWHNFFYASFDAGFVTVDKPPLGLWVQAISAKLFGFQGWSLLLPQAVAGVISVAVLYHLVRRAFGQVAGLLAALTLALTPISVAINRHNNLEGLLVLTVLLAAWAFVLATESGNLRLLLLGAALVGLGFNIKMMEAFLVAPAFYLLYLVAAPVDWRRRIVHLALATVVLVAVSLSWAVAVDLTPPDQRPYISTTRNNTVLDLILGFNGANRLTGSDVDVGERGPLRLLSSPLVEQVGWLLPLAIVGLAAASWQVSWRPPLGRWQQALVLWGMWIAPQIVFFSIAGDWDPHYLAMLAPGVAALVGIGLVALWREYQGPGWHGLVLPLTLLATAGLHVFVLAEYAEWNSWLRPAIAILCLEAIAALVIVRLDLRFRGSLYGQAAVIAGLVALLIAPAVWAASTIWYGEETRTPSAGPKEKGDRAASSQFVRDAEPLLAYLQANRGDAAYLVASADRDFVRYAVLSSNDPVIAFGGFNGNDPVLSAERLAGLVADGAVRYIQLEQSSGRRNTAAAWVVEHCEELPKDAWQTRNRESGKDTKGMNAPLFDCGQNRGASEGTSPPLPAPTGEGVGG